MYETNYLAHHGVKGMKWGVRRYQNKDGTLTKEGQKKYYGKLIKRKERYKNNIKFNRSEANRLKKEDDKKYSDLKKHGVDSSTWLKRSYSTTLGSAEMRENLGGASVNINDVRKYNSIVSNQDEMRSYVKKVKTDSKFRSKQISRADKALTKLKNYKIGDLKTKQDYKKHKKQLKKIYKDSKTSWLDEPYDSDSNWWDEP